MNADIIEKLISLGLSRTEARLYVEGLSAGAALSANELQTKTGIKRPTVYNALNTLAAKGLVSRSSDEGKVLFSFSRPKQLQSFLRSKLLDARSNLESAQLLIEPLQELTGSSSSDAHPRSSVSQYSGVEGVRAVVESALNCNHKSWKIIAPKKNFFSEFDEEYAQYFMQTRRRRGITSKSLWEAGFLSRGDTSSTFIQERNPRYLPESMSGAFSSVMILFDYKIAIISSLEGLSATLIESQETSELMGTMFDALWENADPYPLPRAERA